MIEIPDATIRLLYTVNCHLVGNVHWVQIFKSKSNFPRVRRVRIILNAEIEFFNNDCYATHTIIIIIIIMCKNTIIIRDFKSIDSNRSQHDRRGAITIKV